MTKEEFLAIYPSISETVNKHVPYINHGGCGVYAYVLSLELKKLGIHHSIVGFYFGEWETSFDHFVVKVGKVYLDCEGIKSKQCIDSDQLTYKFRPISRTNLKKLLDTYEDWNETFNRENTPTIQLIIAKGIVNKGEITTPGFKESFLTRVKKWLM